jgi:hypothetical protein
MSRVPQLCTGGKRPAPGPAATTPPARCLSAPRTTARPVGPAAHGTSSVPAPLLSPDHGGQPHRCLIICWAWAHPQACHFSYGPGFSRRLDAGPNALHPSSPGHASPFCATNIQGHLSPRSNTATCTLAGCVRGWRRHWSYMCLPCPAQGLHAHQPAWWRLRAVCAELCQRTVPQTLGTGKGVCAWKTARPRRFRPGPAAGGEVVAGVLL